MNVSRLMKELVSRLNELIMNIKFPFSRDLIHSFEHDTHVNRPGIEACKVYNVTLCVLLTVKLS